MRIKMKKFLVLFIIITLSGFANLAIAQTTNPADNFKIFKKDIDSLYQGQKKILEIEKLHDESIDVFNISIDGVNSATNYFNKTNGENWNKAVDSLNKVIIISGDKQALLNKSTRKCDKVISDFNLLQDRINGRIKKQVEGHRSDNAYIDEWNDYIQVHNIIAKWYNANVESFNKSSAKVRESIKAFQEETDRLNSKICGSNKPASRPATTSKPKRAQ